MPRCAQLREERLHLRLGCGRSSQRCSSHTALRSWLKGCAACRRRGRRRSTRPPPRRRASSSSGQAHDERQHASSRVPQQQHQRGGVPPLVRQADERAASRPETEAARARPRRAEAAAARSPRAPPRPGALRHASTQQLDGRALGGEARRETPGGVDPSTRERELGLAEDGVRRPPRAGPRPPRSRPRHTALATTPSSASLSITR